MNDSSNSWRVYGGPPPARTFTTRRAARRLMRRYARLGIQASLYRAEGGSDWTLVCRQDAGGEPYSQPEDAPDDISGINA